MKFDKVNFLVVILALAVIILLIKDKFKGDNETILINDVAFQDNHYDKGGAPKQNSGVTTPDPDELKKLWASEKKTTSTNQLSRIVGASTKDLKEFKEQARVNFDLSKEMNFAKLDLEHDRMIGTFGVTNSKDEGLAILATDTRVNDRLLMAYLRDYADELPNLRGKKVTWSKQPEVFPQMEGSGLSGAKIWLGQGIDGKPVAAAYVERLDRKGHYVFVYSTNNVQSLQNDGFFDEIYSTLKAVPSQ